MASPPPQTVSKVGNSVTTIQQESIGNVQLIEARLLELYSSIRALYRSNQDLLEATKADPDPVFQEALEENWEVLRRQRLAAMQLVIELKQRGMRSFDLPPDICDMQVPAHTTTTPNDNARQIPEDSAQTQPTAPTTATEEGTEGGVYLW